MSLHKRRLARYEQVVALRAAGESKLGIARRTGLDRRTADTRHFPERAPAPPRPTGVDPFAEFLAARVAAGEENAAPLTRELVARGYRGSYQAVRRAVTRLRVRTHAPAAGERPESGAPAAAAAVDRPAKQVVETTPWVIRAEDLARDAVQRYVHDVHTGRAPRIADAAQLTLTSSST